MSFLIIVACCCFNLCAFALRCYKSYSEDRVCSSFHYLITRRNLNILCDTSQRISAQTLTCCLLNDSAEVLLTRKSRMNEKQMCAFEMAGNKAKAHSVGYFAEKSARFNVMTHSFSFH